MTRVLLYASTAVVLAAFGFAVSARAPSAALIDTTTRRPRHDHRADAGVTGMVVTRGRR